MRKGENQRYEHHQLLEVGLDLAGLVAMVIIIIVVGAVAAFELDDNEGGESQHNPGPDHVGANDNRRVRTRETDAVTSYGHSGQPGNHETDDGAKRAVTAQFSQRAR